MAENFAVEVTEEPTAITAANTTPATDLVDDTNYTAWNQGRKWEVYIVTKSSIPEKDDPAASRMTPWGGNGDTVQFSKESGDDVYVWKGIGGGGKVYLACGEAPA